MQIRGSTNELFLQLFVAYCSVYFIFRKMSPEFNVSIITYMRVFTVVYGEVEPSSSLVFNYVRDQNFFGTIGFRLGTSIGTLLINVIDIYKEEMQTHYFSDLEAMIDSGILSIMSTFCRTKTSEVHKLTHSNMIGCESLLSHKQSNVLCMSCVSSDIHHESIAIRVNSEQHQLLLLHILWSHLLHELQHWIHHDMHRSKECKTEIDIHISIKRRSSLFPLETTQVPSLLSVSNIVTHAWQVSHYAQPRTHFKHASLFKKRDNMVLTLFNINHTHKGHWLDIHWHTLLLAWDR